MSALHEAPAPEPLDDRRELLLLKTIYRSASAMLNAPYLKEHTDSLSQAVADYNDFKRRRYS